MEIAELITKSDTKTWIYDQHALQPRTNTRRGHSLRVLPGHTPRETIAKPWHVTLPCHSTSYRTFACMMPFADVPLNQHRIAAEATVF